jgi:hypothetical protein
MNLRDIKRLVRVYRQAEAVGLVILSCSVQRALLHVAHHEAQAAESRLRESVRFCEIAMSGTDKAREFAPGAKAIIQNILKKEFDNPDSGGKI